MRGYKRARIGSKRESGGAEIGSLAANKLAINYYPNFLFKFLPIFGQHYLSFSQKNNMLNLSHKKLDVYIISLKLLEQIYIVTRVFPTDEKFLLVNQLRRASISVCSNIAEGASRVTKPEKRRFLEISRSSLVEIDTQLEIALMIKYLEKPQIVELENYVERVFMMLTKMMEKLTII